jgi:hypothetical protein
MAPHSYLQQVGVDVRSVSPLTLKLFLIQVKSSIDIFVLIKSMIKLRALNVQCGEDECHAKSLENDEFVK